MLSTLFNYRDIIIKQLRTELQEKNNTIMELNRSLQKTPAPACKKLKWFLNDDNYRVAVESSGGHIIQVKSVTGGVGEINTGAVRALNGRYPLKKTYFESEAEWRASLPQNGLTTVTLSKF